MNQTTRPGTKRPSIRSLERRIAQADRQSQFAGAAGWEEVAQLYERLAADLRALLVDPR